MPVTGFFIFRMNKLSQSAVYLIVCLILLTGGYSALRIGEATELRGDLKTLSYIIRITEHLHTAIDGLQKERAQAESRVAEAKTLFSKQVIHTDHHFDLFQKELRKTQIRMLAMPDSEISEFRMMLKSYRNRILSGNIKSPFYYEVVQVFEIYLKKLYEFGRLDELSDYEADILNTTHLKEMVQQDVSEISRKLSRNASPGEVAILKQHLGEKTHLLSKVKLDGNGHWLNIATELQSLPDAFSGSDELGQRYQNTTEIFWNELRQHEKAMVVKLQDTINNRLSELRDDIIKTLLIGVTILLVLIGLMVLIRKWEPKPA